MKLTEKQSVEWREWKDIYLEVGILGKIQMLFIMAILLLAVFVIYLFMFPFRLWQWFYWKVVC